MELDVKLDAQVLQTGLNFALEGGIQPLLCMFTPDMLRLAVRYEDGILLSWEQPFRWNVEGTSAFIMPAQVTRMLAHGGLEDVQTLSLWAAGKDVRIQIENGSVQTDIRWQWMPSLLGAPDELEPMLVLPKASVSISRSALVACIQEKLESDADAVMAIAQVAPTLSVDGQHLGSQDVPAVRFEARALAHMLELLDGEDDHILVEVHGAHEPPFLKAVSHRDGWRTQCALRAMREDGAALPKWEQDHRGKPLDVMRLALLDTIEALEESEPDLSA